MKKIVVLVLAVFLAFSLVACSAGGETPSAAATESAAGSAEQTESAQPAAQSGEKDEYVIGVTIPNMQNESNAVYAEAMQKYADELGNVKLLVTDGAGSAENQVSQCETFATQGVDAVILCPYDAQGCVPAAQACVDAGIPVLTSKVEIADQSLVSCYVGADDFNGGQIEMQYIADKLGGKGNIVVLEGPTGISAATRRMDGINDVLRKYPDIKVLHTQPADWDRNLAMQTMENWLQLGEQIDAVVAHNDEMALGAYDALKDAGKEKEVPVIGIDAIDAALESVKAGGLTATVFQDVEGIARKAVDVALEIAQGKPVDENSYIDYVLIDSSNIDEYAK